MKIVLTGGATGGHLFPLVAVARKIKEKMGENAEFLYLGSGAQLEKEIMEREEIKCKFIFSGKVRRYFSVLNFIDFLKIPVGIIQALWILLFHMPDVVFSKGGYVSIPVVLAAWAYRIPIIIHESDAVPGVANRVLSKFSNRVAIAYSSAQSFFESSKIAIFGNPVREEVLGGDSAKAREFFNFTESKSVILVLGGSQGSKTINEAVIKILPKLLDRYQVIHQTGKSDYKNAIDLAGRLGIKAGREGYFAVEFLNQDEIKNAYALADLVVSRAGASSISEIAACKKSSILIPLKNSANDHQRMNAYEIAKVGGTLVLEESNLGENFLMGKIEKILESEELRKSMQERIFSFYHPRAAENIANGVIELANKS